MALEKNDLKQIRTIVEETVEKSENRLNQKIDGVKTELNKKIDGVEKRVMGAVESSEKRVMAVISREVGDLAEINHAVIDKVDRIDILEKRLTRVEHKVGIVG